MGRPDEVTRGSARQRHRAYLPERFRSIFPRMRTQNWLGSYDSLDGVQLALTRISRRLRSHIHLDEAMPDITANYAALEANFSDFFADLIEFARNYRPNPL